MFRRTNNQVNRQAAGTSGSSDFSSSIVFALLISGLTMSGCGSRNSATPDDSSINTGQAAAQPLNGEVSAPNGLLALQDGLQLLRELPSVHSNETLADSGLQVAYTNANQRVAIDPLYIERQWQLMQRCTGLTAIAPLIIVSEGRIAPFTRDDDVLHHIDGSVTASASYGVTGASIQVSDADFDGSLGTVGFNTRSILGRYLWLSSSLAERDYPYDCARLMSAGVT